MQLKELACLCPMWYTHFKGGEENESYEEASTAKTSLEESFVGGHFRSNP
jgi:hypothetical protein